MIILDEATVGQNLISPKNLQINSKDTKNQNNSTDDEDYLVKCSYIYSDNTMINISWIAICGFDASSLIIICYNMFFLKIHKDEEQQVWKKYIQEEKS